MPTPCAPEEVSAAVRLFDQRGDAVRFHHRGEHLAVVFEVDNAEHQARAALGVGPITNLRDVAALWELPYEWPVATSSIRAPVLNHLMTLDGAVSREARGEVARRVRQPGRVLLAAGALGKWTKTLSALGSFVTVAPRVVVGTDACFSEEHRLQAALWGLGLAVAGPVPRVIATPVAPIVEFGPHHWCLAEQLYQAWLSGSVISTPTPSVAVGESVGY
jgi:hypothetical protein